MSITKAIRRKTKPSPSLAAAATADPAAAATLPDLEDQLFRIACRVAVYTHAAEHINNDQAPDAQREAVVALPIALGEIHTDLMNLVDQLGDLDREARS